MKKRLFTFFMLLGVISSALLAFTGNWKALLALYVLGTLGFNGSCVYYDSFLLDVTTEERMDRVSTLGYGLGYIGGSTIPLVLSLLLIQLGDAIGIGTMLATRISFLLTAAGGWCSRSPCCAMSIKSTALTRSETLFCTRCAM